MENEKKRKSICIIGQTASFGGAEIHTLSLIKLLIEKGYALEFISCSNRVYDEHVKKLGSSKIKLIYMPYSTNDRSKTSFKQWKKLLKKLKSSTLILPKGWSECGSNRLLLLYRFYFKKVYYIEHLMPEPLSPKVSQSYLNGLLTGLGLWWYGQKLRRMLRHFFADRIIAVSKNVQDGLIKNYGVPIKKIEAVPNGVNWREFIRDKNLGDKFRRQNAIPEEAFVFGIVARLSEEKGIDVALRTIKKLVSNQDIKIPVFLVIAGEGTQRSNLEKLCKKLDISSNVLFLGFQNNTHMVYSGIDVILLPSRKEGLPLTLLEAMAAGCLPIVTRVGGMPEVVSSKGGWVVEPEDDQELCEAMKSALFSSKQDINEKKENNVNLIKQFFDAQLAFKNILDTLCLK